MPYQSVPIGSLDLDAVDLKVGGVLGLTDAPGGILQPDQLRHLKKRMVVLEESDSFGLPLIDTVTGVRKSSFILLIGPEGVERGQRHRNVPPAHGHSVQSVRGGGYLTLEESTLRLEGESTDYGSVPTDLRRRFGFLLSAYFKETMDLTMVPEEAFLDVEESPNFDRYTKPFWLRFQQVFKAADERFYADMLRLKPEYELSESRAAREINAMYFREAR